MTRSSRGILKLGLAGLGVLMMALGFAAWDPTLASERQVALAIAGIGLGVVLALWATLGKALLRAEAVQRSTEETLREREGFLANVAETSPMTIFAFDVIGNRTVYTNRKLAELLGYAPSELDALGEGWVLELLHPDDRKTWQELGKRYDAAREHEVVHSELRFRRPDGSYTWLANWVTVAERAEDGRAGLVIGASIDVSEQKQAEAALLANERRFRMLAEHAHDIVSRYEVQPEPHMAYISPAVESILGYPTELFYEDPGMHYKLIHPDDREELERLDRGSPAALEAPITLRWLHRDGHTVWIEQRMVPVLDENGQMIAVENISRDITEQRRLEEQLLQSQKMDAIGRLAGGIAHDFNNLLGVTMGYIDVLQRELPARESTREALDAIRDVTNRAATLTRQLLAFGRRELARPRTLDLNHVVRELDGMLRRVIPESIELDTRLAEGLWPVRTDPVQVEQIVLNLAVNARDAMPNGGRLVIETRNEEHGAIAVGAGHASPGELVTLIVRDTGVGMDEKTRVRVFEPFFTTKDQGKGTGLGLATVYGIMQQNGGAAHVDSAPGQGTVFTLAFPRAELEPTSERTPSRKLPRRLRGGSVLVVEDEEVLRHLVARTLRQDGYTVLEAADGPEAQSVLRHMKTPVDLLLTDVVMPNMSGHELASWLLQQYPGVRVVYMSGYTDDEMLRHGVRREQVQFIAKPFSPDELVATIGEMLGSDLDAAD